MFKLALAALAMIGLVRSAGAFPASCRTDAEQSEDNLPKYRPSPKFESAVAKGQRDYIKFHFDYRSYLNFHTWEGIYFRYNTARSYAGNPDRVSFDEDGLPRIRYPALPESQYAGGYEYNPTTLIQFGLMEHAKILAGESTRLPIFLTAVQKLLSMQDARGGFGYPFPFKHFQNAIAYEPGWVSAISQGQALSLLARAYALTGDDKYVQAGKISLNLLLKPISEGGLRDSLADLDRTLSGYVMFEEYPILSSDTKSNYTINGFMHTLVGLYDWSFVSAAGETSDLARQYYSCGLATLRKIIPFVDVGGFSAYDLGHIIYGRRPIIEPSYHEIHIYMLLTFYQLSHDEFFLDWANKWQRDVEPSFVQRQFVRWSIVIYALVGTLLAGFALGFSVSRWWQKSRPLSPIIGS